jgi:hypothetical protein
MIDALHSLTRNPLPAITALNLRSNRLASLAGIERLYPLERLDLRDNRLTDPTELARLTGIPDLREIWVAGNPFTRTHSNYRVTIFNLFRRTPGYTEDIIIDASGPGYNERRQLVDRVAERPNVPVVKPSQPDYGLPTVNVHKPTIVYGEPREPAVLRKERPVPTSSEIYATGSRRRRTPKRRIVDLSTSDTSPVKVKNGDLVSSNPDVQVSAEHNTASTAGSDSGYGVSPENPPLPVGADKIQPEPRLGREADLRPQPERSSNEPKAPRLSTLADKSIPQLLPVESLFQQTSPIKVSPPDNQDWSISGEMYRKKIEALRNEVGNGWLSVLSEEGWEPHKSPTNPIRPSTTRIRANSQQAIHSGRTLG